METITIRSDFRLQNELKEAKRLLDVCQRANVSKFWLRLFDCRFNGPSDTSVTVLRSDIDNRRDSIRTAEGELRGLRARTSRGQTYASDTYRSLLKWKKAAERTLSLMYA